MNYNPFLSSYAGVPLRPAVLSQPILAAAPTRVRYYNPITGIPYGDDDDEDEHVVSEFRMQHSGVIVNLTGKKSEVIRLRKLLAIMNGRLHTENNRQNPDSNHILYQLDSNNTL